MTEILKEKKRVAIYLRVSTIEQAEDGYGLDAQKTKILDYIRVRENDYEFAGEQYVYIDDGVSGADPLGDRPGLDQLIADVSLSAEKPFDVVMVYKIDRFARKLNVLLDIVDQFDLYDIGFVSTQEALDTDNAFGKAMLGILGVFSELERDMILERTQMGKEEALKKGVRYVTKKYGYRKDNKTLQVKVEKREAEIIKRMFEMLVYERKTVTQIRQTLRDEKVLIPTASMNLNKSYKNPYKWEDKTIRNILGDEVYIGKYYYHKQKTIVNKKNNKKIVKPIDKKDWKLSLITHDIVISEKLFNDAQEILENRKWQKTKGDGYILSGLLKCDCCKEEKSKMSTWTGVNSRGTKYYQCNGKKSDKHQKVCTTVPLRQEDLDKLVIKEVKRLLDKPEAIIEVFNSRKNKKLNSQIVQKEINRINKRLISISKERENAKILFEMDHYTKEKYLKRIGKIDEENKNLIEKKKKLYQKMQSILDLEAQQKSLEALKRISGSISNVLDDPEKAKVFLGLLIDEIVLYSRDKTDKDIISGPKPKYKQTIPYVMMIKFRLPQDFLDALFLWKPKNNPDLDNGGLDSGLKNDDKSIKEKPNNQQKPEKKGGVNCDIAMPKTTLRANTCELFSSPI